MKRALFKHLPLLVLVISGGIAVAQDGLRTEQVHFPAGQTGTSIKGTIVGYQSVSYMLGAEAGQLMTVALTSPNNTATYFNVYEPGRGPGEQALAVSGTTGPMTPNLNEFRGTLSTSGMYTISVYMMRSAARRSERSDYTLDISISPLGDPDQLPPVRNDYADGLQGGPDYWDVTTVSAGGALNVRVGPSGAARVVTRVYSGTVLRNLGCRMSEGRRWCKVETLGGEKTTGWAAGEFLRESSYTGAQAPAQSPDRDAEVPGTNFNATGNIPCVRYAGQPMANCRFGVVRAGNGNGSITIFWPGSGNRVIYFEAGTPTYYDQSEADAGATMTVGRNADLFMVTIGDQRFEIPDAVIFGG